MGSYNSVFNARDAWWFGQKRSVIRRIPVSSRKPSPLQQWRAQYAYIAQEIRKCRVLIRSNSGKIIPWADYDLTELQIKRAKRKMATRCSSSQSEREYLRRKARILMEARVWAQAEARRLWERNRQKAPEDYTGG